MQIITTPGAPVSRFLMVALEAVEDAFRASGHIVPLGATLSGCQGAAPFAVHNLHGMLGDAVYEPTALFGHMAELAADCEAVEAIVAYEADVTQVGAVGTPAESHQLVASYEQIGHPVRVFMCQLGHTGPGGDLAPGPWREAAAPDVGGPRIFPSKPVNPGVSQ